jgi:hypothetical protein
MPEVSRFLGIIIRFYYNDHAPPHFHADYAEFRAQIAIENHTLIGGHLPPRVLGLVQEWAGLHRLELQRGWDQSRRGETPDRIEPLV